MTSNVSTELKPIYLIFSEDKLLTDQALKRLKDRVKSQEMGQLNVAEFRLPFIFAEIEQALYTVGFFSQKKVIILHQAEKLTVKEIEKIDKYLSNPNPDVTLVLVAQGKNEKLFLKAKKHNYYHEYKSPKGGQLSQWVVDRFKSEGKKITFETASYLVRILGTDLSLLTNEIEKIILYNDDKEQLDLADIAPICSHFATESIFDLVDALGRADLSSALLIYNSLLSTESDSKIFFMIIRQFKLLLKTKGLIEEGVGVVQISKALGLPSFIASKYIKQARHFSISKLIFAHKVLLDTDVKNKTSASELKSSIEIALIKILAA